MMIYGFSNFSVALTVGFFAKTLRLSYIILFFSFFVFISTLLFFTAAFHPEVPNMNVTSSSGPATASLAYNWTVISITAVLLGVGEGMMSTTANTALGIRFGEQDESAPAFAVLQALKAIGALLSFAWSGALRIIPKLAITIVLMSLGFIGFMHMMYTEGLRSIAETSKDDATADSKSGNGIKTSSNATNSKNVKTRSMMKNQAKNYSKQDESCDTEMHGIVNETYENLHVDINRPEIDSLDE